MAEGLAERAAIELDRLLAAERAANRRDIAWGSLVRESFDANSRQALCQAIHNALEKGLGPCQCVLRVEDERQREDGNRVEVLERLYPGDNSTFWPEFRTRGENISTKVWLDKKTWVCPDVREDSLLRQIREETGSPVPWIEEYGSFVVAPQLVEGEMVGTLAVLRRSPEPFLRADVAFIEQVANLAGQTLTRLTTTEEQLLRGSLSRALVDYFRNGHDVRPGEENGGLAESRDRLLQTIKRALTFGLNACAGYAWSYDNKHALLRGLSDLDDEKPTPRNIEWSAVAGEFPAAGFQVVPDPATDRRLTFPLAALAEAEQAEYQSCPRVGILLARTTHLKLRHPGLFFFVGKGPQRFSYRRIQRVVWSLATTLSQWE